MDTKAPAINRNTHELHIGRVLFFVWDRWGRGIHYCKGTIWCGEAEGRGRCWPSAPRWQAPIGQMAWHAPPTCGATCSRTLRSPRAGPRGWSRPSAPSMPIARAAHALDGYLFLHSLLAAPDGAASAGACARCTTGCGPRFSLAAEAFAAPPAPPAVAAPQSVLHFRG